MEFENLRINRAVVHTFGTPADSIVEISPSLSNKVQNLERSIQEQLRGSIVTILTSGKKTFEMSVVVEDQDSAIEMINTMVGASDDSFLEGSHRLATLLSRTAPGASTQNSVLLVADGTIGVSNHRSLIVVMAQKHGAFRYAENIGISVITDLFLGGQQRINKIAIFEEVMASDTESPNRDRWVAATYDDQNATTAAYFAQKFLGLDLAPTGARYTMELVQGANKFISSSSMPVAERARAERMLTTEVWDSSAPMIDVHDLAPRMLPAQYVDDFVSYIEERGVPTHAFERDTNYLSKPRSNRLHFSNGVVVQLPWGLDDSEVVIESSDDGWTTVKIHGTQQ